MCERATIVLDVGAVEIDALFIIAICLRAQQPIDNVDVAFGHPRGALARRNTYAVARLDWQPLKARVIAHVLFSCARVFQFCPFCHSRLAQEFF